MILGIIKNSRSHKNYFKGKTKPAPLEHPLNIAPKFDDFTRFSLLIKLIILVVVSLCNFLEEVTRVSRYTALLFVI